MGHIKNFEQAWLPHPDPTVDLCVLPVGGLISEAKIKGKNPFYITLDQSLIPTDSELEELTFVEDVLMIGYPNGLWDSHNNSPIMRRGITATHPARDYEGRREFMIDAAYFPGSSGSPVLLFNIGGYPGRDGGFCIDSRIKLLGILYAGPQYTATGELQIETMPTADRVVAVSRIPNNLGLVIKANRLRDFEPLFKHAFER